MGLQAFLDELTKIASAPPSPSRPIPINAVAPKGPSVPNPGGLPKQPVQAGLPMKLAAANGLATILPGATAKAKQIGSGFFPKQKAVGHGVIPQEGVALAMFGGGNKGSSLPSKPPPASARVTPATGPTTNTIPSPAQSVGGFTIPAPGRMPKIAFVAPGGAPPVSAASPAPAPITPSSGRAYAAMRGVLAGPKKPPMQMKVGEDAGHGQPGHDHKASVEKLRAVMKEKHPHLLEKKADLRSTLTSAGKHLVKHEDAHEIAGLASLALPSIDNMQARLRGGDEHSRKQLLPEMAHDAMEVGGLGYLAAPMIAKKGLGKAAVQAMGH